MFRTTARLERLLSPCLFSILLVSACGGNPPADSSSRDLLGALAGGRLIANTVDPGHPTCRALLGNGWYPAERGSYAWTRARQADLDLPVTNVSARRLVLVGYGLGSADGPRRVEVLLNGASLGERTLPRQAGPVEWEVPPHCLHQGLNDVVLCVDRTVRPSELGVSDDARPLGVFVDWIGVLDADEMPDLEAYTKASLDIAPGRWLATRLAHGAGATCALTWQGQTPTVRVAKRLGDTPVFEAVVAPSEPGRGSVTLPDDLPPGGWLLVGVAGEGGAGKLTGAELRSSLNSRDVLLIVVDTLRPDYLGCYGAGADASPAIDALAADGILFENAFCHVPITGPSHATLFTSHYPVDTGILNNAGGVLPTQLPTVAEILAERGWDTRAAVSISTLDGRWQFGRGFATYDDRLGDTWILRADTMVTRIEALRRLQSPPRFLLAHFADPHEPYDAHGFVARTAEVVRDGRVIATIPTSTYTPTRLELDLPAGVTELVLRSADPFRLRYVGCRGEVPVTLDHDLPDVLHEPGILRLTATAASHVGLVLQLNDVPDAEAPVTERYAREVAFADRHVGMILDALRAEGRYDETLIVFVADHGEALGEHGYLGHVDTLYDVMVRVPLIIKPPRSNRFETGVRRRDPAALVDVLPTILARLGLPPLAGARGRDLLADGAEKQSPAVFMETHRPEADRNLYGLRTSTAKLVYEPDTATWEYYDLATDPSERTNLADRGSDGFEEHRQMLLDMLTDFGLDQASDTEAPEIDPHTVEMLRALGY